MIYGGLAFIEQKFLRAIDCTSKLSTSRTGETNDCVHYVRRRIVHPQKGENHKLNLLLAVETTLTLRWLFRKPS